MEAKQYLIEVQRTVSPHNTPKTNLLGLRGETGEVADVVKKVIGHAQGWAVNHNVEKMIEELGDSCWYAVAALTKILGPEVTPGVMSVQFFIPESLEDLADMLCEAGSKIGHATFPFEAHDAGQEFFGIVHTIAAFHLPLPMTLGEVWDQNVAKLRKRYPEGFTTAASLAKADESIKAPPCGDCGEPCSNCQAAYGGGCDGMEHGESCGGHRRCICVMPAAGRPHASIPAALQFEVDNHATAGNGYPPKTTPWRPTTTERNLCPAGPDCLDCSRGS